MLSARVLVIAGKELLQLRRDRLTLAMMVALPILQLLLFGYAINTDVRHIPTVVYDQDQSAHSRDLGRSLHVTGFYDLVGQVRSYEEIGQAMRRGVARVGLVIPAGYAEKIRSGSQASLQLVVDGSDPQTTASATNTAALLVFSRSRDLESERARQSGARAPPQPLQLETDTWYNPELRSAVNIVPGLVGVILTMTMVMLTAMAIARERERGTLEQLIVSPVGKLELILGKILPYVLTGYVQMSLVLIAGRWVFDVPVQGSLPLLYGLAFVFIAANLALGLFFSTLAATQQQAMQMSFFFLLPNILLSGFMFPFEGMPRPAQVLAQFLPLTHFMRMVRGVVLKGANFSDLATEFYWLCALLAALIALTSLRFTKKLV